MPSSDGDRHHFVPQFMLRRFRGRTQGGRRLFVLDKRDGSIEETTPRAAGWEHRLYAMKSVDGRFDGFMEGLLGLAEGYAAQSIEAILQAPASLSDDDRGNIAYLVAAQEQRVPRALEDLRMRMIIGASTLTAVALANTKGSRKKQRQGREAYGALIAGETRLEPSAEAVLEMALISLANTAQTIFRLPWTLYRAKPGAGSFVCSDPAADHVRPAAPAQVLGTGVVPMVTYDDR